MRFVFSTFAAVLVLFLGISNADSIYAVTGNLSLTGTNACTPSPCKETIDFSFELGYKADPAVNPLLTTYVPYIVAGSMSATSIGPLGSFAGFEGLGFGTSNYIPFTNSGNNVEIDLNELGGSLLGTAIPFPGPPVFPNAVLFSCAGVCSQDFNFGTVGTVEASIVPVSEGPESIMLGIAAIVILGFAVKKNPIGSSVSVAKNRG